MRIKLIGGPCDGDEASLPKGAQSLYACKRETVTSFDYNAPVGPTQAYRYSVRETVSGEIVGVYDGDVRL